MLSLQSVYKSFGSAAVMKDFSLVLNPGSIHCLFGPSGCGKTTLMRMLAGLITPDRGSMTGVEGGETAFVFQEDRLLPWLTARENVSLVLESRRSRRQAAAAAAACLAQVGLGAFLDAYPEELSGGMKQRAAIARALAYGGGTLLLDEPFKGLDHSLRLELMELVLDRFTAGEARTVVMVTHDPDEALYMADTVYMLKGPPLQLERTLAIPLTRQERRAGPEKLLTYRNALLRL